MAPGILFPPFFLFPNAALASHMNQAASLNKGFTLIHPTGTLTAMQMKILELDAEDLTESKA